MEDRRIPDPRYGILCEQKIKDLGRCTEGVVMYLSCGVIWDFEQFQEKCIISWSGVVLPVLLHSLRSSSASSIADRCAPTLGDTFHENIAISRVLIFSISKEATKLHILLRYHTFFTLFKIYRDASWTTNIRGAMSGSTCRWSCKIRLEEN